MRIRLRMLDITTLVAACVLATGRVGECQSPQTPVAPAPDTVKVIRLTGNPIVTPQSDPTLGNNINGPSLIRVPNWVHNPLGAYYLYFADHNGKYIRLAYADKLQGPWRIYKPGTLLLSQSYFTNHIASPDVIVDDDAQQIRMYYHGLTPEEGTQHTRVAISNDGLNFTANREPVGRGSAYWRLFKYDGWWYALAMPGRLFRSRNGLSPFEPGPHLFPTRPSQVHNAVLLKGNKLEVYYTRSGDAPERILFSRVTLGPDWNQWKPSPPQEFLKPETPWEGANLPLVGAHIGALDKPENALRDPAIFCEAGKSYILYAVAGESGIAIAEIQAIPK